MVILSEERPEKLPMVQRTKILSSDEGEKYCIKEIREPATLATIIPKISSEALSFNLEETNKIRSVTANAPSQAATTTPISEKREAESCNPKAEKPIIKKATPKPAPELSPKIKGSARGFLKRVCICNPQIESATPDKMAVITLGTR